MKYFEQMRDKYGFGDGDMIPEDAWARRHAYVEAINYVAELLGSEYRAYAYDRPGMHNGCFILFTTKSAFEAHRKEYGDDVYTGTSEIKPAMEQPDEAMSDALDRVKASEIDTVVHNEVTISPKAMEAIKRSFLKRGTKR